MTLKISMKRREFLCLTAGLALSPSGARSVEAHNALASYPVSLPIIARILGDDELRSGVCLLDVGSTATEVSAYRDNACLARNTVSFGANSITGAIGQWLSVDYPTARALLNATGHAFPYMVDARETVDASACSLSSPLQARPSRRDLAYLIQAEFERLFVQVRIFLQANSYDLPCGVVVHGGIAALPGIVELGEEVFHSLVRTVPAHENRA